RTSLLLGTLFFARSMRSSLVPRTNSLLGLISFFVSSRRRHTRSKRDWSSDVCSSDLIIGIAVWIVIIKREPVSSENRYEESPQRSEERRVGKECRSRRSPNR